MAATRGDRGKTGNAEALVARGSCNQGNREKYFPLRHFKRVN